MPSPLLPSFPLPFPTISEHEVQRAIFSPKKSTPEQDSIPTSIKKSWSCLAGPITSLFQLCLEKDWHPSPFHQAAPVALPKPGKREAAPPWSYRFIALLSVLEKDLERLMARRKAWGSHHTQNPPPSTSLEPSLAAQPETSHPALSTMLKMPGLEDLRHPCSPWTLRVLLMQSYQTACIIQQLWDQGWLMWCNGTCRYT